MTDEASWREILVDQSRGDVIRAMGAFLRAPLDQAEGKKRELDKAWADYDAGVRRTCGAI